jgi:hypothetical protein
VRKAKRAAGRGDTQSNIWIHDIKCESEDRKQNRQQGEIRKQTHHDREEIIKRSEVEVGGGCGWSAASEGSKEGALDGGGGVIPAFSQARMSCSRRSSPRAWNPAHGHRALSTSVVTRNVFASSSACTRPLSPSHSARHLIEHIYIYKYDLRQRVRRGGLRTSPLGW